MGYDRLVVPEHLVVPVGERTPHPNGFVLPLLSESRVRRIPPRSGDDAGVRDGGRPEGDGATIQR
jgi:hypothetical protein